MTAVITHLIAFAAGVLVARAASRNRVRKAERNALALLHARHAIELTAEDAARRAGC
jgi:hypothetical protein